MKDKIGIIVDGQGDYASLRARFNGQYKIIKTDGPRGHCATNEQIVSNSRKQIRILRGFGCGRIIALIDYECRNQGIEAFIEQLNKLFIKEHGKNVEACVPNRMIENWYLADIVFLSKNKKYLKTLPKQKNYEGTHGKEELKKLMVNKAKYNEVKHGSELFGMLRFEEARKNSPSFNVFLQVLAKSATA